MRLVAVLAMIVGLSACGEAPAPSASQLAPTAIGEPSTSAEEPTLSFAPLPAGLVEELLGPWQPTPLELDLDAIRTMDAQCLAFNFMAPSVSLVVVDARGDGRVILQYAGEDGNEGTCEATVQADGRTQAAPISNSSWPQDIEVVPLGDVELRTKGGYGSPSSAGLQNQWSSAIGQAGAGIEQVIAEVPSQPSAVVASLNNGWFVFWAPLRAREQWRIVGLNAAGEEVATIRGP